MSKAIIAELKREADALYAKADRLWYESGQFRAKAEANADIQKRLERDSRRAYDDATHLRVQQWVLEKKDGRS